MTAMTAKRKRNLRLLRRGNCTCLGQSMDSDIVHPVLPDFCGLLSRFRKIKSVPFLNVALNNRATSTLVFCDLLCTEGQMRGGLSQAPRSWRSQFERGL